MVAFFEKCGNCENNIKEAKDNMAGRLLPQSYWSNEAIFQLMTLAYNLFLLYKMDFLGRKEYRQKIKTCRSIKFSWLERPAERADA